MTCHEAVYHYMVSNPGVSKDETIAHFLGIYSASTVGQVHGKVKRGEYKPRTEKAPERKAGVLAAFYANHKE